MPIELTEREMAVAKEAARIAVQELSDEFYKGVGRTIVTKIFVWVGMIAAGFAAGKGWLPKL